MHRRIEYKLRTEVVTAVKAGLGDLEVIASAENFRTPRKSHLFSSLWKTGSVDGADPVLSLKPQNERWLFLFALKSLMYMYSH